ncbi:MAG: histidine kinase [Microscillaceae bacterium]|nr:histidine kinase [Microscillaceae bacterium]
MPHTANLITLEFVGISFVEPLKNEHAYQLVGIDNDWIYSGARRTANYTNLPPGRYHFKLKVANPDGYWSPPATFLEIEILPAFWQTTWFQMLVLLGLLGLLGGIYQLRIRQIRRESDFKHRLAETEMAALRAQMNPHFIFNTLSSIHHFILSHDTKSAGRYLTRFAELIRGVLEHSKESRISLARELRSVGLYIEMEQLRFSHRFDFYLDIAPDIKPETVFIPPLLIQPFIENAIWHGLMQKETPGFLKLSLQMAQPRLLMVIIEDNGVGRAQAKVLGSKTAINKKSFGLKITSERMEILNQYYQIKADIQIQDLKDINEKPAGTRVCLKIPF